MFSDNGTNAAQNTTAAFSMAGNYTFQVTITDPGGLTATSERQRDRTARRSRPSALRAIP